MALCRQAGEPNGTPTRPQAGIRSPRFTGGMASPLLPVYSLPKMASGLWWAACGNGASGDMADLAGGVISLLVAAVFLAILAYAVPSVPLWIVILVGFALMVASFIETWRSDQSR